MKILFSFNIQSKCFLMNNNRIWKRIDQNINMSHLRTLSNYQTQLYLTFKKWNQFSNWRRVFTSLLIPQKGLASFFQWIRHSANCVPADSMMFCPHWYWLLNSLGCSLSEVFLHCVWETGGADCGANSTLYWCLVIVPVFFWNNKRCPERPCTMGSWWWISRKKGKKKELKSEMFGSW